MAATASPSAHSTSATALTLQRAQEIVGIRDDTHSPQSLRETYSTDFKLDRKLSSHNFSVEETNEEVQTLRKPALLARVENF